MKVFVSLIFFTIGFHFYAQSTLGTWKGVLIRNGQKTDQADIIYLDLQAPGEISRSREEVAGKDAFILRRLKTEVKGNQLICKQTNSEKRKDLFGHRWCSLEFTLEYVDSTGYLTGTYTSLECKGNSGKIICFRMDEPFNLGETDVDLQSWRPIFIDDLKNNRKSKEKREEERLHFQFHPIYFDFDKSEIRDEYKPFLRSIIRIINGHTDLRVKVTGHTDAIGSDNYNDGLSERRANAIIDFFVSNGLARDRIVIDFKGEKVPASDNVTDEGRQLNRRVDFAFI